MSLLKELRTSETSGSSIKISSLRDFGTTPPIRAASPVGRLSQNQIYNLQINNSRS